MIRKVLTFFRGELYILQSYDEGFLRELIFISFKRNMSKFPPFTKADWSKVFPFGKGESEGILEKECDAIGIW
jgi:hypothetical protein